MSHVASRRLLLTRILFDHKNIYKNTKPTKISTNIPHEIDTSTKQGLNNYDRANYYAANHIIPYYVTKSIVPVIYSGTPKR